MCLHYTGSYLLECSCEDQKDCGKSVTELLRHLPGALMASSLFLLMPLFSRTGLYKSYYLPGQQFHPSGSLTELLQSHA